MAGLGLVAAGTAYFLKTEKGKKLLAQAREKGRELLQKAREQGQAAREALEPSTTPQSLTPGEPADQVAT